MVTGMWHVMEPREEWDIYTAVQSWHLPSSLHFLAGQAPLFFRGEKQECCSLVQVVLAAQKTLLEGAELLSGLSRGVAPAEMETWFL